MTLRFLIPICQRIPTTFSASCCQEKNYSGEIFTVEFIFVSFDTFQDCEKKNILTICLLPSAEPNLTSEKITEWKTHWYWITFAEIQLLFIYCAICCTCVCICINAGARHLLYVHVFVFVSMRDEARLAINFGSWPSHPCTRVNIGLLSCYAKRLMMTIMPLLVCCYTSQNHN